MFNATKLKDILVKYKEIFVHKWWSDEKYKWEAVKCFQDNWDVNAPDFTGMLSPVFFCSILYRDVNAPDFTGMLSRSLEKTSNLLASMNNFPAGMIKEFSQISAEYVRSMFIALFDESKDVVDRILEFKRSSDIMLEKHGAKQHYQYENAISTYLWLHYPNKYYIYKYGIVKKVATKLESNYVFKQGAYTDNLRNFYAFYNEIRAELKNDRELSEMLASQVTDTCYPDKELCTLTADAGFFISKYLNDDSAENSNKVDWYPSNYNPEITIETWEILLKDSSIFTQSSLEIIKRLLDYGGQATCTQLAVKYGESKNFYNAGSVALAKRIARKLSCEPYAIDDENIKWWSIIYIGKKASKEDSGSYVWKLRNELAEALKKIDLSEIPLYADMTPSIWKISHGTENTGIPDEYKRIFAERQVAVVHGTTKSKATTAISQGERFIHSIKKGDYFYLCYGNNIQLLGQFTADDAIENPELQNGWMERPYRVITRPVTNQPYTGEQRWWTPNDNSTCIKVDDTDAFEKLILMPYFGISTAQLYRNNSANVNYWWLNANPKIWRFSSIAVGEKQSYTLYNDNGNKRRIFQNFLDAKAGDRIICYESNPVKQIVCIGRITAEQDGKELGFEKTEALPVPIDYQTLKECPELDKMEYFGNPNGSLFKLTKGEFDFILDVVREANPIVTEANIDKYGKKDFLDEVFMSEADYDRLVSVLAHKKNIILQGAPGVGKTFTARRLAYSIMGQKDETRIKSVQFHQNYSYEDFVMGYKPDGNGFKLENGIFHKFCTEAGNYPQKKFFFIIDEINRGNMSKIFGELLMLIEKDYRGTKTTLAYNGMPFSVPENLYIIGMMNTADRSLAMIDYALRRRFSFFDMAPGYNSEGFRKYQEHLNSETLTALITQIRALNEEIMKDKSLGKGFCIGHSYFCGKDKCDDAWLRDIVDYDILPMLNEYWFDDETKVQSWKNKLLGIFQ